MIRFRIFRPGLAAILAGAAILWASTPARAGYAVQVYDDGVLQSGVVALVSGNSLIYTGSTTHFDITNGSGTSNNPGTQGGTTLGLSNNSQITTDFGDAGGTHTITIVLSQTNFTAPKGSPLVVTASAGGSMTDVVGTNPNASDTVTSTFQGFLDNSNTLFGQPAAGGTPSQTASNSLSGVGTAPLVYTPPLAVNNGAPGGTPFSLTDVLSFTFTVDAGSGQDTAGASVRINITSVPEPSSITLMGLGALGLVGYGLRRRTIKGA
jgi:hypothetical protein